MSQRTKQFLAWRDIGERFGCGRSKALLIIHTVGPVYVGRVPFVRASDLDAYLAEHGSIDLSWPR